MGLKLEDDLADDVVTGLPDNDRRLGWAARVPLLPVVAGIGAVGMVAAAWSTSQISLNFAGGAPLHTQVQRMQHGPAGDGPSRSEHASTVTITFRATSRSATGFHAEATITNHGKRTIDGWVLMFRIPNARVLAASNVVLVRSGSVATLRNPAGDPKIEPGHVVRLVFTARGAASTPSACSFNGSVCALA